jgi:nucleoporin POM152
VTPIPKPTLSIPKIEKSEMDGERIILNPVCANSPSSFQVDFSGKAPWKVVYQHAINGRQSRMHSIEVETSFLKISVDTSTPMTHTFDMRSISDGNYQQPMQVDENVIVQQVLRIPSVKFLDPPERVLHCVSRDSRGFELNLLIDGVPPFNIVIEEKYDNIPNNSIEKTIDAADMKKTDNGYLYILKTNPQVLMGRYDYRIVSILDKTGCEASFEAGENLVSTIEVADQAKITASTPSILCIGDLASFDLQGTPPFTVGYKWNEEIQEILVDDPILTFWVGKEGELAITKICNSLGCCDNNLSKDESLLTVIKPLPVVIVGGGNDVVDDIREGDVAEFEVEFKGEPPFSFTYTRTIGGKGRPESKTVSDIQTHKVVFFNPVVNQNISRRCL